MRYNVVRLGINSPITHNPIINTSNLIPPKITIAEDSVVRLGERVIEGKEFIKIFDLCEKLVRDKFPEEFI